MTLGVYNVRGTGMFLIDIQADKQNKSVFLVYHKIECLIIKALGFFRAEKAGRLFV